MRAAVAAVLLVLSTSAHAASNTLTADPVPDSMLQPEGYKCSFTPLAQTAPIIKTFPVVRAQDNSVRLQQDLTTVLPPGVYTNTFCVATKASVPDSDPSNVISQFVLGKLSAPSGFVIIVK